MRWDADDLNKQWYLLNNIKDALKKNNQWCMFWDSNLRVIFQYIKYFQIEDAMEHVKFLEDHLEQTIMIELRMQERTGTEQQFLEFVGNIDEIIYFLIEIGAYLERNIHKAKND